MCKMNDLSVRRVICFLEDEQGGGAIMELTWFSLLVGVCGLSIIMLDQFRISTALPATANASAQAAFIDLPFVTAENEATATEAAYAQTMMPMGQNGEIASMTGVAVGEWAHPRHGLRLPVSVH